MDTGKLTETVVKHLEFLCSEIGERNVGSVKNRTATLYLSETLQKFGWNVLSRKLNVTDWETDGAVIISGDEKFEVFPSEYSLGCDVFGELVIIDTVDKLKIENITGKIVMFHGEIAATQLAPKNFPFWNPDEHKLIYGILEENQPAAIISATKMHSPTAGGVDCFSMFEDGDFDIPSVYMNDVNLEKFIDKAGENIRVISKSRRIDETAYNVVGRNEGAGKKIVLSAHIDTKIGTPGAIDNATGVATLLTLAEIFKHENTNANIELAFFNGEDYYSVPGQVDYLKENKDEFANMLININIDGMGLNKGLTCFSPLNITDELNDKFQKFLASNNNIVVGNPWYEGDHSMFLQNGCAAIAVSSQWFIENMASQTITHTPNDNLSIVSVERVVECVENIKNLVNMLK